MSLASSRRAWTLIDLAGLSLWNRKTWMIRQLVITLADSVAELCVTLIRFELADLATGGFSLSGSILLGGR